MFNRKLLENNDEDGNNSRSNPNQHTTPSRQSNSRSRTAVSPAPASRSGLSPARGADPPSHRSRSKNPKNKPKKDDKREDTPSRRSTSNRTTTKATPTKHRSSTRPGSDDSDIIMLSDSEDGQPIIQKGPIKDDSDVVELFSSDDEPVVNPPYNQIDTTKHTEKQQQLPNDDRTKIQPSNPPSTNLNHTAHLQQSDATIIIVSTSTANTHIPQQTLVRIPNSVADMIDVGDPLRNTQPTQTTQTTQTAQPTRPTTNQRLDQNFHQTQSQMTNPTFKQTLNPTTNTAILRQSSILFEQLPVPQTSILSKIPIIVDILPGFDIVNIYKTIQLTQISGSLRRNTKARQDNVDGGGTNMSDILDMERNRSGVQNESDQNDHPSDWESQTQTDLANININNKRTARVFEDIDADDQPHVIDFTSKKKTRNSLVPTSHKEELQDNMNNNHQYSDNQQNENLQLENETFQSTISKLPPPTTQNPKNVLTKRKTVSKLIQIPYISPHDYNSTLKIQLNQLKSYILIQFPFNNTHTTLNSLYKSPRFKYHIPPPIYLSNPLLIAPIQSFWSAARHDTIPNHSTTRLIDLFFRTLSLNQFIPILQASPHYEIILNMMESYAQFITTVDTLSRSAGGLEYIDHRAELEQLTLAQQQRFQTQANHGSFPKPRIGRPSKTSLDQKVIVKSLSLSPQDAVMDLYGDMYSQLATLTHSNSFYDWYSRPQTYKGSIFDTNWLADTYYTDRIENNSEIVQKGGIPDQDIKKRPSFYTLFGDYTEQDDAFMGFLTALVKTREDLQDWRDGVAITNQNNTTYTKNTQMDSGIAQNLIQYDGPHNKSDEEDHFDPQYEPRIRKKFVNNYDLVTPHNTTKLLTILRHLGLISRSDLHQYPRLERYLYYNDLKSGTGWQDADTVAGQDTNIGEHLNETHKNDTSGSFESDDQNNKSPIKHSFLSKVNDLEELYTQHDSKLEMDTDQIDSSNDNDQNFLKEEDHPHHGENPDQIFSEPAQDLYLPIFPGSDVSQLEPYCPLVLPNDPNQFLTEIYIPIVHSVNQLLGHFLSDFSQCDHLHDSIDMNCIHHDDEASLDPSSDYLGNENNPSFHNPSQRSPPSSPKFKSNTIYLHHILSKYRGQYPTPRTSRTRLNYLNTQNAISQFPSLFALQLPFGPVINRPLDAKLVDTLVQRGRTDNSCSHVDIQTASNKESHTRALSSLKILSSSVHKIQQNPSQLIVQMQIQANHAAAQAMYAPQHLSPMAVVDNNHQDDEAQSENLNGQTQSQAPSLDPFTIVARTTTDNENELLNEIPQDRFGNFVGNGLNIENSKDFGSHTYPHEDIQTRNISHDMTGIHPFLQANAYAFVDGLMIKPIQDVAIEQQQLKTLQIQTSAQRITTPIQITDITTISSLPPSLSISHLEPNPPAIRLLIRVRRKKIKHISTLPPMPVQSEGLATEKLENSRENGRDGHLLSSNLQPSHLLISPTHSPTPFDLIPYLLPYSPCHTFEQFPQTLIVLKSLFRTNLAVAKILGHIPSSAPEPLPDLIDYNSPQHDESTLPQLEQYLNLYDGPSQDLRNSHSAPFCPAPISLHTHSCLQISPFSQYLTDLYKAHYNTMLYEAWYNKKPVISFQLMGLVVSKHVLPKMVENNDTLIENVPLEKGITTNPAEKPNVITDLLLEATSNSPEGRVDETHPIDTMFKSESSPLLSAKSENQHSPEPHNPLDHIVISKDANVETENDGFDSAVIDNLFDDEDGLFLMDIEASIDNVFISEQSQTITHGAHHQQLYHDQPGENKIARENSETKTEKQHSIPLKDHSDSTSILSSLLPFSIPMSQSDPMSVLTNTEASTNQHPHSRQYPTVTRNDAQSLRIGPSKLINIMGAQMEQVCEEQQQRNGEQLEKPNQDADSQHTSSRIPPSLLFPTQSIIDPLVTPVAQLPRYQQNILQRINSNPELAQKIGKMLKRAKIFALTLPSSLPLPLLRLLSFTQPYLTAGLPSDLVYGLEMSDLTTVPTDTTIPNTQPRVRFSDVHRMDYNRDAQNHPPFFPIIFPHHSHRSQTRLFSVNRPNQFHQAEVQSQYVNLRRKMAKIDFSRQQFGGDLTLHPQIHNLDAILTGICHTPGFGDLLNCIGDVILGQGMEESDKDDGNFPARNSPESITPQAATFYQRHHYNDLSVLNKFQMLTNLFSTATPISPAQFRSPATPIASTSLLSLSPITQLTSPFTITHDLTRTDYLVDYYEPITTTRPNYYDVLLKMFGVSTEIDFLPKISQQCQSPVNPSALQSFPLIKLLTHQNSPQNQQNLPNTSNTSNTPTSRLATVISHLTTTPPQTWSETLARIFITSSNLLEFTPWITFPSLFTHQTLRAAHRLLISNDTLPLFSQRDLISTHFNHISKKVALFYANPGPNSLTSPFQAITQSQLVQIQRSLYDTIKQNDFSAKDLPNVSKIVSIYNFLSSLSLSMFHSTSPSIAHIIDFRYKMLFPELYDQIHRQNEPHNFDQFLNEFDPFGLYIDRGSDSSSRESDSERTDGNSSDSDVMIYQPNVPIHPLLDPSYCRRIPQVSKKVLKDRSKTLKNLNKPSALLKNKDPSPSQTSKNIQSDDSTPEISLLDPYLPLLESDDPYLRRVVDPLLKLDYQLAWPHVLFSIPLTPYQDQIDAQKADDLLLYPQMLLETIQKRGDAVDLDSDATTHLSRRQQRKMASLSRNNRGIQFNGFSGGFGQLSQFPTSPNPELTVAFKKSLQNLQNLPNDRQLPIFNANTVGSFIVENDENNQKNSFPSRDSMILQEDPIDGWCTPLPLVSNSIVPGVANKSYHHIIHHNSETQTSHQTTQNSIPMDQKHQVIYSFHITPKSEPTLIFSNPMEMSIFGTSFSPNFWVNELYDIEKLISMRQIQDTMLLNPPRQPNGDDDSIHKKNPTQDSISDDERSNTNTKATKGDILDADGKPYPKWKRPTKHLHRNTKKKRPKSDQDGQDDQTQQFSQDTDAGLLQNEDRNYNQGDTTTNTRKKSTTDVVAEALKQVKDSQSLFEKLRTERQEDSNLTVSQRFTTNMTDADIQRFFFGSDDNDDDDDGDDEEEDQNRTDLDSGSKLGLKHRKVRRRNKKMKGAIGASVGAHNDDQTSTRNDESSKTYPYMKNLSLDNAIVSLDDNIIIPDSTIDTFDHGIFTDLEIDPSKFHSDPKTTSTSNQTSPQQLSTHEIVNVAEFPDMLTSPYPPIVAATKSAQTLSTLLHIQTVAAILASECTELFFTYYPLSQFRCCTACVGDEICCERGLILILQSILSTFKQNCQIDIPPHINPMLATIANYSGPFGNGFVRTDNMDINPSESNTVPVTETKHKKKAPQKPFKFLLHVINCSYYTTIYSYLLEINKIKASHPTVDPKPSPQDQQFTLHCSAPFFPHTSLDQHNTTPTPVIQPYLLHEQLHFPPQQPCQQTLFSIVTISTSKIVQFSKSPLSPFVITQPHSFNPFVIPGSRLVHLKPGEIYRPLWQTDFSPLLSFSSLATLHQYDQNPDQYVLSSPIIISTHSTSSATITPNYPKNTSPHTNQPKQHNLPHYLSVFCNIRLNQTDPTSPHAIQGSQTNSIEAVTNSQGAPLSDIDSDATPVFTPLQSMLGDLSDFQTDVGGRNDVLTRPDFLSGDQTDAGNATDAIGFRHFLQQMSEKRSHLNEKEQSDDKDNTVDSDDSDACVIIRESRGGASDAEDAKYHTNIPSREIGPAILPTRSLTPSASSASSPKQHPFTKEDMVILDHFNPTLVHLTPQILTSSVSGTTNNNPTPHLSTSATLLPSSHNIYNESQRIQPHLLLGPRIVKRNEFAAHYRYFPYPPQAAPYISIIDEISTVRKGSKNKMGDDDDDDDEDQDENETVSASTAPSLNLHSVLGQWLPIHIALVLQLISIDVSQPLNALPVCLHRQTNAYATNAVNPSVFFTFNNGSTDHAETGDGTTKKTTSKPTTVQSSRAEQHHTPALYLHPPKPTLFYLMLTTAMHSSSHLLSSLSLFPGQYTPQNAHLDLYTATMLQYNALLRACMYTSYQKHSIMIVLSILGQFMQIPSLTFTDCITMVRARMTDYRTISHPQTVSSSTGGCGMNDNVHENDISFAITPISTNVVDFSATFLTKHDILSYRRLLYIIGLLTYSSGPLISLISRPDLLAASFYTPTTSSITENHLVLITSPSIPNPNPPPLLPSHPRMRSQYGLNNTNPIGFGSMTTTTSSLPFQPQPLLFHLRPYILSPTQSISTNINSNPSGIDGIVPLSSKDVENLHKTLPSTVQLFVYLHRLTNFNLDLLISYSYTSLYSSHKSHLDFDAYCTEDSDMGNQTVVTKTKNQGKNNQGRQNYPLLKTAQSLFSPTIFQLPADHIVFPSRFIWIPYNSNINSLIKHYADIYLIKRDKVDDLIPIQCYPLPSTKPINSSQFPVLTKPTMPRNAFQATQPRLSNPIMKFYTQVTPAIPRITTIFNQMLTSILSPTTHPPQIQTLLAIYLSSIRSNIKLGSKPDDATQLTSKPFLPSITPSANPSTQIFFTPISVTIHANSLPAILVRNKIIVPVFQSGHYDVQESDDGNTSPPTFSTVKRTYPLTPITAPTTIFLIDKQIQTAIWYSLFRLSFGITLLPMHSLSMIIEIFENDQTQHVFGVFDLVSSFKHANSKINTIVSPYQRTGLKYHLIVDDNHQVFSKTLRLFPQSAQSTQPCASLPTISTTEITHMLDTLFLSIYRQYVAIVLINHLGLNPMTFSGVDVLEICAASDGIRRLAEEMMRVEFQISHFNRIVPRIEQVVDSTYGNSTNPTEVTNNKSSKEKSESRNAKTDRSKRNKRSTKMGDNDDSDIIIVDNDDDILPWDGLNLEKKQEEELTKTRLQLPGPNIILDFVTSTAHRYIDRIRGYSSHCANQSAELSNLDKKQNQRLQQPLWFNYFHPDTYLKTLHVLYMIKSHFTTNHQYTVTSIPIQTKEYQDTNTGQQFSSNKSDKKTFAKNYHEDDDLDLFGEQTDKKDKTMHTLMRPTPLPPILTPVEQSPPRFGIQIDDHSSLFSFNPLTIHPTLRSHLDLHLAPGLQLTLPLTDWQLSKSSELHFTFLPSHLSSQTLTSVLSSPLATSIHFTAGSGWIGTNTMRLVQLYLKQLFFALLFEFCPLQIHPYIPSLFNIELHTADISSWKLINQDDLQGELSMDQLMASTPKQFRSQFPQILTQPSMTNFNMGSTDEIDLHSPTIYPDYTFHITELYPLEKHLNSVKAQAPKCPQLQPVLSSYIAYLLDWMNHAQKNVLSNSLGAAMRQIGNLKDDYDFSDDDSPPSKQQALKSSKPSRSSKFKSKPSRLSHQDNSDSDLFDSSEVDSNSDSDDYHQQNSKKKQESKKNQSSDDQINHNPIDTMSITMPVIVSSVFLDNASYSASIFDTQSPPITPSSGSSLAMEYPHSIQAVLNHIGIGDSDQNSRNFNQHGQIENRSVPKPDPFFAPLFVPFLQPFISLYEIGSVFDNQHINAFNSPLQYKQSVIGMCQTAYQLFATPTTHITTQANVIKLIADCAMIQIYTQADLLTILLSKSTDVPRNTQKKPDEVDENVEIESQRTLRFEIPGKNRFHNELSVLTHFYTVSFPFSPILPQLLHFAPSNPLILQRNATISAQSEAETTTTSKPTSKSATPAPRPNKPVLKSALLTKNLSHMTLIERTTAIQEDITLDNTPIDINIVAELFQLLKQTQFPLLSPLHSTTVLHSHPNFSSLYAKKAQYLQTFEIVFALFNDQISPQMTSTFLNNLFFAFFSHQFDNIIALYTGLPSPALFSDANLGLELVQRQTGIKCHQDNNNTSRLTTTTTFKTSPPSSTLFPRLTPCSAPISPFEIQFNPKLISPIPLTGLEIFSNLILLCALFNLSPSSLLPTLYTPVRWYHQIRISYKEHRAMVRKDRRDKIVDFQVHLILTQNAQNEDDTASNPTIVPKHNRKQQYQGLDVANKDSNSLSSEKNAELSSGPPQRLIKRRSNIGSIQGADLTRQSSSHTQQQDPILSIGFLDKDHAAEREMSHELDDSQIATKTVPSLGKSSKAKNTQAQAPLLPDYTNSSLTPSQIQQLQELHQHQQKRASQSQQSEELLPRKNKLFSNLFRAFARSNHGDEESQLRQALANRKQLDNAVGQVNTTVFQLLQALEKSQQAQIRDDPDTAGERSRRHDKHKRRYNSDESDDDSDCNHSRGLIPRSRGEEASKQRKRILAQQRNQLKLKPPVISLNYARRLVKYYTMVEALAELKRSPLASVSIISQLEREIEKRPAPIKSLSPFRPPPVNIFKSYLKQFEKFQSRRRESTKPVKFNYHRNVVTVTRPRRSAAPQVAQRQLFKTAGSHTTWGKERQEKRRQERLERQSSDGIGTDTERKARKAYKLLVDDGRSTGSDSNDDDSALEDHDDTLDEDDTDRDDDLAKMKQLIKSQLSKGRQHQQFARHPVSRREFVESDLSDFDDDDNRDENGANIDSDDIDGVNDDDDQQAEQEESDNFDPGSDYDASNSETENSDAFSDSNDHKSSYYNSDSDMSQSSTGNYSIKKKKQDPNQLNEFGFPIFAPNQSFQTQYCNQMDKQMRQRQFHDQSRGILIPTSDNGIGSDSQDPNDSDYAADDSADTTSDYNNKDGDSANNDDGEAYYSKIANNQSSPDTNHTAPASNNLKSRLQSRRDATLARQVQATTALRTATTPPGESKSARFGAFSLQDFE